MRDANPPFSWADFAIGIFAGVGIMTLLLEVLPSNSTPNQTWQSAAIKHHCAHYNAPRPDFDWNAP